MSSNVSYRVSMMRMSCSHRQPCLIVFHVHRRSATAQRRLPLSRLSNIGTSNCEMARRQRQYNDHDGRRNSNSLQYRTKQVNFGTCCLIRWRVWRISKRPQDDFCLTYLTQKGQMKLNTKKSSDRWTKRTQDTWIVVLISALRLFARFFMRK